MIFIKHEERVRVEHIKLSIAHAVFFALEIVFAILALLVQLLVPVLASWAGENLKMKLIGIAISFLCFGITLGLTLLFQNMAFNSRDELEIAGWTENYDVVYKYKSEILAEIKMGKRGFE